MMPFLLLTLAALSQEPPKNQPQIRVNYLNVCNPSDEEQQEIRKALASIPAPKFTVDYEVSRGVTTLPDAPTAKYVRLRHEFPTSIPFIAAQYSFSVDEKSTIENLVFRSRDPKDVIQIQLEDTVAGNSDPKTVMTTDTPVNRIKLERFGKNSVALARCQGADQSVYEPLFQQASGVMERYRAAMGIKRLLPRELSMMTTPEKPKKPAEQLKK